MKSVFLTLVSAGAIAFSAVAPAQASLVTYIGADNNVASLAQMTNSAAAAASFDAATLGSSLITFESPLPMGVSISGGSVSNSSGCGALCGINTTAGGQFFLSMFGGSATFNFTAPINFFGAYLTGLQTNLVGQQTVTFTDGSSQSINFPSAVQGGNGGGGAFIGFTDFGKSISSVTINATNDIITVDDARYGVAAVPEPDIWALLIAGFGLTGAAMRRRRVTVAA